ncbi:MAG: tetratricopeptide repeat protein, partial [Methylocystis sp.]|nr:tetratricopeptide repeat protein [Methylocystis sp.]
MSMAVAEAFVSGSLGQAVFRDDGALRILDAPNAEARDALPNDIYWFRNAAREVAPVEPNGLPVAIAKVRSRLEEEIRFFNGLDGLLVGMDPDFSDQTRKNAISRAELALSKQDDIARRIRERFLIPVNTQEWNPEGGLALALENGAASASACYRPLAEGIIDRLADDIAAVVLDKLGAGLDGARARETILRSGLLAELALIEMRADRAALSTIVFRRGGFPKLRAVDPSGQILTTLTHWIETRLPKPVESEPIRDATDPIIAAVDRAKENVVRRRGRQAGGGASEVAGIKREIEWIGERLQEDEIERAEAALVELIDRQGARGGRGHIIMTLTAVADLARKAKLFEWTWRLLHAIDRLGLPDATALCVRAETLRELGRPEEALAVFEKTMRRFPRDEVAPTAYAETLRDLGRPEEALAAFEETMRRFPRNEVAPTAYAETLRDLGRPEEALAAFEETMRRFPRNEVAPTAYAETL